MGYCEKTLEVLYLCFVLSAWKVLCLSPYHVQSSIQESVSPWSPPCHSPIPRDHWLCAQSFFLESASILTPLILCCVYLCFCSAASLASEFPEDRKATLILYFTLGTMPGLSEVLDECLGNRLLWNQLNHIYENNFSKFTSCEAYPPGFIQCNNYLFSIFQQIMRLPWNCSSVRGTKIINKSLSSITAVHKLGSKGCWQAVAILN